MGLEWERGKGLEKRVKEILNEHRIQFKEGPSLTDFDLRADFLVDNGKETLIIEVTYRNSNEDVQRLCLRSATYKQDFRGEIKTLVILPSFKGTRSLRLYMFLLKFFDYFLFIEDLSYLPDLISPTSSTKGWFLDYLKMQLSKIYPEIDQLLNFLKENNRKFTTLHEISAVTKINQSRVKQLLHGLDWNLEKLGIIEFYGEYCRLTERFI